MSDRTNGRVGRPTLGESTASCWGLLGASLTWQPGPRDDDQDGSGDRLGGGTIANGDQDASLSRVIDVAEADREARRSSVRTRRR